jgi:hypothetical protein
MRMSRGIFLASLTAIALVWASSVSAQAPAAQPAPQQPAQPAPQPAQGQVSPAPQQIRRAVPASVDGAGCNTVEKPVSAGGASIVREAAGQQKSWQPTGGEISFTVRSFVQIPYDALVLVCFRWKRTGEHQDRFITARPIHLDLTDAGRLLTVTVVVPPNLRNPPPRFGGDGEYVGLYFVPLAEVRILVVGKSPDGSALIAADVSHEIGVTNPLWGVLFALLTVLAGFTILTIVCHRRLKRFGYDNLDPFIRIIATPDGYASLSQFQMILWTFVVAGSAVYVMVLSGELIEITTGTLVLLGISGTVTVGSKLHDAGQTAKAPPPLPGAPLRKPHWSDLVINEVNGQREIDISRVQMLYFTLVTASFVVMRVLTTYVIPEIPEGFQILMGISNAVYFGSKVAQPAASAAAVTPDPAPPPAQS